MVAFVVSFAWGMAILACIQGLLPRVFSGVRFSGSGFAAIGITLFVCFAQMAFHSGFVAFGMSTRSAFVIGYEEIFFVLAGVLYWLYNAGILRVLSWLWPNALEVNGWCATLGGGFLLGATTLSLIVASVMLLS